MNISRSLYILVALLIFVIVGELIYLLYISPVQKDKTLEQSTKTKDIPSVPTRSPIQTNNSAISQDKIDALDSIKVFKKGVLQESILNYKVGGQIIQIEDTTSKDEDGNDMPVKSIKIQGDKGFTNTFFFSNERLKNTEVRNISSTESVIMKFEDLKVGDKISIQYAIDLLDELNYNVNIKKVIINKE